MPGLSFSNQGQNRRPGLWWIPVVLIIISVMLITLCVRLEGGGPFAVVRGAVQTVTKPLENVCSVISTPFRNIGATSNSEELAKLEQENMQLRTLVAELEEYRQQDQRLAAMSQFQDIYGLETLSGEVMSTTSGWDRTATINKGSQDGVRVGMAVMSTCGLYGQVEAVTSTTCTVRLISDVNSSVSAMVQNSRAHGILHGSYDGTLTLEYVPVEKSVGKGDIVITSGSGGAYPRGIVIGTVRTIETDSSKLYHRITVDPIYSIDSCEEVLILTGSETEAATIIDEALLKTIIDNTNTVRSEASSAIAVALLNNAKGRSAPMTVKPDPATSQSTTTGSANSTSDATSSSGMSSASNSQDDEETVQQRSEDEGDTGQQRESENTNDDARSRNEAGN